MLFDPLALPPPPPDLEPEGFIGACESSLDFLQQVYRDPAQPMQRRLRAAIAALPFEHPKLAVMAKFDAGAGFAARLEAAIARSGKVIDASPHVLSNKK